MQDAVLVHVPVSTERPDQASSLREHVPRRKKDKCWCRERRAEGGGRTKEVKKHLLHRRGDLVKVLPDVEFGQVLALGDDFLYLPLEVTRSGPLAHNDE